MNAKKIMAMVLAVVLLMTATVAGTIAWLKDSTDTVENTFTVGEVDISLKESPYTAATPSTAEVYGEPAEGTDNKYPAIPGNTYKKDPVVSVTNDSEKCYLFVKFEYSEDADTYLNYTSTLTTANGWTKLDTASSEGAEVWYRIVEKDATVKSWNLLADLGGDYEAGITLEIDPDAVDSDNMTDAAAQSLKWTAYAVQYENVADAAEAWQLINA